MITERRLIHGFLSAALALAGIGVTAETQVADVLRVQLDITADDKMRPSLHRCLTAQLDAIGGVTIDPEGSVVLRVIGMEQGTTTGDPLGYLFYAAGLIRVSSENDNAVAVKWEGLRATPADLSVACKQLSTDFEKEVIQSIRDAQDMMRGQVGGR